MVVTFDEKVSRLEERFQEQNTLIQGSDEHLDLLNHFKSKIDPLTKNTHQFCIEITTDLNSFDNNKLTEAIPKLLDLYSSAIRLVATLKRHHITRQLKDTVQAFSIEIDNLHEVIYDLEKFRLSDDEGLDNILTEINAG